MTTYLTYNGQPPRTETDEAVIANLVRKGWVITEPPVVEEVPPTYTAEQWIEQQGYGGQRPTTCLYLLLQLQAAGKSSPKLTAVQQWMDSMIAAGVGGEERNDWPSAPYAFAEASGEALGVLQP